MDYGSLLARGPRIIAALLLLAPATARAQTTSVTDGSPTEAKLVAIDRGSRVVPTSLVREYGRLLDRLSRECQESRPRIGDIVVKSTQLLKSEKGVRMSNKQMLDTMNKAIADGARSLNIRCAEVAAMLVVAIDRP